jgi:flagellar basal-body rod modification protein FlgD
MTTTATSATSSTASTSAKSVFGSNINTFMTMLITQLKNQDPTSPMDTAAFTQQLTQFAGIEQQITTNSTLSSINTTLQNQTTSAALGYLGRNVTYDASQAVADGAGAAWNFTPTASGNYTASVVDSSGKVVYAAQTTLTNGTPSTFKWTAGRNDNTSVGTETYTLKLTNSSNSTAMNPSSSGMVNSIDLSSSTPTVTVNGQVIPISAVKTVSTSS